MIYYFPKTKIKTFYYCKEQGCSGLAAGQGLCKFHYDRNRNGVSFKLPKRYKSETGLCEIFGCSQKHAARRMCKMHLKRERDGNALEGPSRKNSYNWEIKDINWHKNENGYLAGKFKGKAVLQHRIFWELHTGDKLRPFENVHHKNGIRDDNRIENLELWTKPQPIGQRPEDLVSWVIDHYRELVEARLALF
jgi:hypothetical protein